MIKTNGIVMDGFTRDRIYSKPYFSRSIVFVFSILFSRGKKPISGIIFLFFIYFITLQYLEGWNLIDTAWFLIVTISTVGYGDVTPEHEISRFLTILLIIVSIGSIAILSTLLFETVSMVSKPKFWNDHQIEEVKYHVIIVGDNALTPIICDIFLEIGIQPIIVANSISYYLENKYLSVVGDIRSAETFVMANIEKNCLGVIITTPNDTEKINAAISIRSLNKEIPVHIILEIRKRVELSRPLPTTLFTDLNLTVIDPSQLLANEISKYLHLGRYKNEFDDFIKISLPSDEFVFEFQADTIDDPSLAFNHILNNDSNDINLVGYSQLETSDFTIGMPFDPKSLSHLILIGTESTLNQFKTSYCSFTTYIMPKHALILGFGETSKVLLPVLAKTETAITVLDIHQEKILEAQKFAIDHVILNDFFELYGLGSTEPFNYDFTIINMPKIYAIAALARIKTISPDTKTVLTVSDAVDAPYLYSHGASLVLVKSQLIAEATVSNFFPQTHPFGNGLIEFITNVPSISIKNLELKLKGIVLAIFDYKNKKPVKYRPFDDKHVVHDKNSILFFHESSTIKRARYGR